MPVQGRDWISECEVAVDTAVHAAGDVLFLATELTYVTEPNGTSIVESITVTDYDDQGIAFDILFLRLPIVIGTLNAPAAFADNLAPNILGVVPVAATDSSDVGNSQVATVRNVGLSVRSSSPDPNHQTSVWIAGIARGAGTYPTGRLMVKVGLIRQ